MLAVVIPTLNSAPCLPNCLPALAGETIVISDGGSDDATFDLALKAKASLCVGQKGRGPQTALGAKLALLKGADWLLFIHSDTRLPKNWREVVDTHITEHSDKVAYFRYAQQAKGLRPWLQSRFVALRCWAWALPYGDQGLLISRDVYEAIGGYSDLPLFEDVDIMNRLKARLGKSKIRALPVAVHTNISAYETQGWLKRGWRNFRLMRQFQKGASVSDLTRQYYND